MPPDELVRACLDEMRNSAEINVAGAVTGVYRSQLLGTEGGAAILVGYAIGVHGADRDGGLELFEALLGAALEERRGGGRLGVRFLDEEDRTIRLVAGTHRLNAPATLDLEAQRGGTTTSW